MEIIALILESPEMSDLVRSLVDGICRLLENIQFNLPGGVLEGESLFDFSNTAIKERYVYSSFLNDFFLLDCIYSTIMKYYIYACKVHNLGVNKF